MKPLKSILATLAFGLALSLQTSFVDANSPGENLEVELTALMNAGRIEDARLLLLARPHDDALRSNQVSSRSASALGVCVVSCNPL